MSRFKLAFFTLGCFIIMITGQANALTGDVTVRLNGGGVNNKAFIGQVNTLEILIRNDVSLKGMSLGFMITSTMPYTWVKPYGTLPVSLPIMMEHGDAVGKFDIGGAMAIDMINSLSPDSFLMGGAALNSPLPVHGSLTLCYSFQFIISSAAAPSGGGFCVDNVLIPLAGSWKFTGTDNSSIAPTFQGNANASPQDPSAPPVCFDIASTSAGLCGDVNCDGKVNVGDAVYEINYIFKSGPTPCAGCP